MKDKIRTCFIFDFMSDLDDEVKSAIQELNSLCDLYKNKRLPIEVTTKAQSVTAEITRTNYDLMIIDYGGLPAGSSTDTVQVQAVCQYAEDHPSCLVVIWTGFTSYIYEDELEDQFGHLDNLVKRYVGGQVYANLNGRPEFIEKFKNWFNITEEDQS